jgi:hypothetical protein
VNKAAQVGRQRGPNGGVAADPGWDQWLRCQHPAAAKAEVTYGVCINADPSLRRESVLADRCDPAKHRGLPFARFLASQHRPLVDVECGPCDP